MSDGYIITAVISSLGLCFSAGAFGVSCLNMVERRHGEIVNLRAGYLTRLNIIQGRITSIRSNMQAYRMELRHMPDCDFKYRAIEDTPRLTKSIDKNEQDVAALIKTLKEIDTIKANGTLFLIRLQSVEQPLQAVEETSFKVEQGVNETLESLRSLQEEEDKRTTKEQV